MENPMEKLIDKYPENFTGEILTPAKVELTAAQIRANSPEAVAELTTHAEALVKWLREYHTPYTEIRITWDAFRLYGERMDYLCLTPVKIK